LRPNHRATSQQGGVSIEVDSGFAAGETEIGGTHENGRIAGMQQGGFDFTQTGYGQPIPRPTAG